MLIRPHWFLFLSSAVFVSGLVGVVINRRNVIAVLIAVELMLLAANINFITFAYYSADIKGWIFSLFALAIAAADAVVGLALITAFFRSSGSVKMEDMTSLGDKARRGEAAAEG